MMSEKEIEEIIAEDNVRKSRLDTGRYDALTGDPDDPARCQANVKYGINRIQYLPLAMVEDPKFIEAKDGIAFERLRIVHDFEYWAARCVKIYHKLSKQIVPFVLNNAQRKVVRQLEMDRKAGRPLRLILLKARQWGGSTLIQMYFAWIQICHRENWNSLICAHVKETSQAIRAMYSLMLQEYPEELWTGEEGARLKPWQRSQNTNEVAGRGCKITVSSSYGQDAARGLDFSMAHLSEVAFWMDTDRKAPEDYIRTVCGCIPMEPLTMVVMESTANGVGNFFHSQWLLAEEGRGAYRPVFVPWYEIEMYRTRCRQPHEFIAGWTPYERGLWDMGLTLDMIQWYHDKRAEFPSDATMQAEYPTTAEEAFINTGSNVFASGDIEKMRADCREALPVARDSMPYGQRRILDCPPGDGVLKVWRLPEESGMAMARLQSSGMAGQKAGMEMRDRYVVAVDIGGRWRHADYSVVAVIDRLGSNYDFKPEIVAQWRGHCDHDILALYAEQVARAYDNALLVVESNSLESGSMVDNSYYVLEELSERYNNMYIRNSRESGCNEYRIGFHTNRSTKAAAISNLIAAVRDRAYTERDGDALNEMAVYELQQNGGYAARRGYNDDILMTRAIGLYVISKLPELTVVESDVRSVLPWWCNR